MNATKPYTPFKSHSPGARSNATKSPHKPNKPNAHPKGHASHGPKKSPSIKPNPKPRGKNNNKSNATAKHTPVDANQALNDKKVSHVVPTPTVPGAPAQTKPPMTPGSTSRRIRGGRNGRPPK